MKVEWMRAEAAIRHVAKALNVSLETAAEELWEAVAEDRVAAIHHRGKPTNIISPDYFRAQWELSWRHDGTFSNALKGYCFRQADIEAEFPLPRATKVEVPTADEPPKHGGGAPKKYDWVGASGHMTGYIVANDPPQAKMTAELRRWFEEQGKVPDKRELERWASAYVNATKKRSRRK